MTDAKRAEHAFRHNRAPRIPRLPERNRQTPFTWAALAWIVFFAVAAFVIASRY